MRQSARNWNFDAYLAATLAPKLIRHDLIAIAAFIGELERIRHVVSEPALAQIRIQWWRDELQKIRSREASEHPIGQALAVAIDRYDLPVPLLIGMADAVFDRVSDARFPDDHALNTWITKRYAAPIDLAVRCLNIDPSTVRTVIDDAARAYGRARLLCETHAEVGASVGHVIQKTRETLIEEADVARCNVAASSAQWPRRQRSVFLPVALVSDYIAAARSPDTPEPTPFQKVRRMAWAHWIAGL